MSGIRAIFFGLLVAVAALVAGSSPTAHAFSSNPKTFVAGDNIFYAYVQSGEKVNIHFDKAPQGSIGDTKALPITVAVDAPGMPQQTCIIPPNVAVGGGCTLNLTAVKDGVWRINFQVPSDGLIDELISPSVKWGANLFNWNITVSDSAGERPGRLWSELYAIAQPAAPNFLADMTVYYISEDGYLYRVVYRGFNGVFSTLSADAFGIVKANTCETVYQSVDSNNTAMKPSFGKCGGNFKLFFEQPSDDLPTTAARWDGAEEWVRPNIDRPVVEGLKFTPDQSASRQAGKISYNLKDFVGQYEVRIDTNGDGDYNGPNDITLKRQIKNLKSAGPQTIEFDGTDRSGNDIPKTQPITIKINIVKTGEIHLIGGDIEGREGGIELVRLSGDNVPSYNVCWDDTMLGATADGLGSQLTLDGTTCPDSTGGVHPWKYSAADQKATWGNNRYINDWVFTSAKVQGTAEIRYPESQAAIQEAAAQRGLGLGIIIAAILVVLGAITALIVWLRRRGRKSRNDTLLPPTQFPPAGPPTLPPQQPPLG